MSIETELFDELKKSQEMCFKLQEELDEAKKQVSKSEQRQKHTWEWLTRHYGKLQDWARKQLPEPFKTEFFNCVANGVWHPVLDVAPPYICNAGFVVRPSGYFHMKTAEEQLLFDQWNRAEVAELALWNYIRARNTDFSDEEVTFVVQEKLKATEKVRGI